MIDDSRSIDAFSRLVQIRDGGIVFFALCAAVKLQLADHIERGLHSTVELANELKASEDAVYRVLRALASHGFFKETAARSFENTPLSQSLIKGAPHSVGPTFLLFGTEFFSRSFAGMEYSILTGEPAASKMFGEDGWQRMRRDAQLATIFDDAMTNLTTLQAPAIVEAYDFARCESITDVGGGNGILLAEILRANPNLTGVLADQPHVLKRASERGLLSAVASRVSLTECDFFTHIPTGSRTYLMKHIIHDWADAEALAILRKCREAVPADGMLLLVEWDMSEEGRPAAGKMTDLIMLVLNGGKERTSTELSNLLEAAGFRLHRVIQTRVGLSVLEALPV